MADFFEKLKKGMEINESTDESAAEFAVAPAAKTKAKKEKKIIKEEIIEEKDTNIDDNLEGELALDIYQSGRDLVITAPIAGIEPEDLDITIENDLVIIKGERNRKITEKKENYFFQECHWGKFKREIILPLEVDSSRAEAKMEKGVLKIILPIIERTGKTKVKIKNKE